MNKNKSTEEIAKGLKTAENVRKEISQIGERLEKCFDALGFDIRDNASSPLIPQEMSKERLIFLQKFCSILDPEDAALHKLIDIAMSQVANNITQQSDNNDYNELNYSFTESNYNMQQTGYSSENERKIKMSIRPANIV